MTWIEARPVAFLIELFLSPGVCDRWCSLLNADLALSVTMTAVSTILSIFALPANLILYAKLSYEADITEQLDWVSVFIALAVVIAAIALGLYCSYRSTSLQFNLIANKVRLQYVLTTTQVYVC
jgi:predicted Na+-dependent transporter